MDMKEKAMKMMKEACVMCEDAGMDPMDALKQFVDMADEGEDMAEGEASAEESPKAANPKVQMIIATMKKKMKSE